MDCGRDGARRKDISEKKALYGDDPVHHAGHHADPLLAIHGYFELSINFEGNSSIEFIDRKNRSLLYFCQLQVPPVFIAKTGGFLIL